MPRGPRLDAPGVLHHVMARGIERQRIFQDDADREDVVQRMAMAIETLHQDVDFIKTLPVRVPLLACPAV
jgi:hypothetical protein